MDATDFSGLVARAVAGLEEVRGCLLVSRDGLTLGAYPQEGEERARHAWDRLESVGEPERGFLVVADEVWVFARRGPYACIVVATAGAKAGLLLDRMESTLRAAEEARMQSGTAMTARPEVTRRPRTPLHRDPRVEPKPPEPVFEQIVRFAGPEQATEAAAPPVPEAPPLVGPTAAEPAHGESAAEPSPEAPTVAPIDASVAPPIAPPASIVVPDVQPSLPPTQPTPPGGGEPAGGAAPPQALPPVSLAQPAPPTAQPAPGAFAEDPAPAAEAAVEPLIDASAASAPQHAPDPEPPAEAPEPPRLARPQSPEPQVPAYEPPTSLFGELSLIPDGAGETAPTEPEALTIPEPLAQTPEPPMDAASSAHVIEPFPGPEADELRPAEPAAATSPTLEEPAPAVDEPWPAAGFGISSLSDLPGNGEPDANMTPDSPKEDAEVDAVALAREFAQLFDEPDPRDGS